MCSDTQETRRREIQTKEYATKIVPIGQNGLLGCAGMGNYINLLQKTLQTSLSSEPTDYEAALYDGTRLYSKEVYLDARIAGNVNADGSLPPLYETEGIFVACDSKYEVRMFELLAPYRPFEINRPMPSRISIGSGGIISDMLLKTAEDKILSPQGLDWSDLSVSVVSKLCALMLNSIGSFELSTNDQARIYLVSKVSQTPVELKGVDLWGNDERPFRVFVKNVLAQHPQLVKNFLKTYLDDDLKMKIIELMGSN